MKVGGDGSGGGQGGGGWHLIYVFVHRELGHRFADEVEKSQRLHPLDPKIESFLTALVKGVRVRVRVRARVRVSVRVRVKARGGEGEGGREGAGERGRDPSFRRARAEKVRAYLGLQLCRVQLSLDLVVPLLAHTQPPRPALIHHLGFQHCHLLREAACATRAEQARARALRAAATHELDHLRFRLGVADTAEEVALLAHLAVAAQHLMHHRR